MTTNEGLMESLDEIRRWVKILALPVLREGLAAELGTPESRKVYQLTDGTRTIREVAESAGVGFGTVQRSWQLWASKGLLEPAARQGRFRRIVDLNEIGLGPVEKPGRSNAVGKKRTHAAQNGEKKVT